MTTSRGRSAGTFLALSLALGGVSDALSPVTPEIADLFEGTALTLRSTLGPPLKNIFFGHVTTTWDVLGPVTPRTGTGTTFVATVTGAGPIRIYVTATWVFGSASFTWMSMGHAWTLEGPRYLEVYHDDPTVPTWTLTVTLPLQAEVRWETDDPTVHLVPQEDQTVIGLWSEQPSATAAGTEVRCVPVGLAAHITSAKKTLPVIEVGYNIVRRKCNFQ